MTPQDLAADLRSRINPLYAAQLGTESYERRLCAEAIEGLIAELNDEHMRCAQADNAVEQMAAELVRYKANAITPQELHDQDMAEFNAMTADRDEWRDEALSAQGRFKQAEAELVSIKGQEPVGHITDNDGHAVWYGYCPPALNSDLYLAAGAQPSDTEAKDVCKLCGSDSPFTGSCGGGRNNPKALCYEAAPVQAGAQVNFEEQPDGSVIPVDPSEMQAQERKPLTDEQIYAIWPYPEGTNSVQTFARAIEAAHGIKEQVVGSFWASDTADGPITLRSMKITNSFEQSVDKADPQPVQQEPITAEAAHDIGAKGGAPSEGERLLFEAWMRGHCWALSATWRGTQYKSDSENGGDLDPHAMQTRRIWAAWRDRAALSTAPVQAQERKPLTDWISVDDRLPDSGGYYLVTVDTDDGLHVDVLLFDAKKRQWLHEGEPTFCHSYYFAPTHWANRPEAAHGIKEQP